MPKESGGWASPSVKLTDMFLELFQVLELGLLLDVTLCLFDVPTVNSLKTGMEKILCVPLTHNTVPEW